MFVRILNSEMELGAVALTAAEAGAALRKAGGTRVEAVTVRASINIIKNAMSAGIPGTSYQGMDYAAAIGAVGGDPVHLLEVMNYVPREQMEEAAALVKAGKVKVEVAQVPQKLYVEVLVTSDGHTGRAVVRDLHTNVVLVEQDGVATLDKQHADPAAAGDSDVVTPEQIAEFLTVRSIWDYCTEELDPLHDPIDIIRSAYQQRGSFQGIRPCYRSQSGAELPQGSDDPRPDHQRHGHRFCRCGRPHGRRTGFGGGKLRQRQSGHHGYHACGGNCPLAGHRRGEDAPRRDPFQPDRDPHQG